MNVLVACEYSGIVRDAFISRGHYALSVDLLPTESPGPHYQGDIMDVLGSNKFPTWDLMIAFPPCRYLCRSGLHWNKKDRKRKAKTRLALEFVSQLLHAADIPRTCVENPIGCINTRLQKPDQYIQPYEFGHDASKATCLWLKNLPPLRATHYIQARRYVRGRPRWANQTDSGQNRLSPHEDRWKDRSRTYTGIAAAMAVQWGRKRKRKRKGEQHGHTRL